MGMVTALPLSVRLSTTSFFRCRYTSATTLSSPLFRNTVTIARKPKDEATEPKGYNAKGQSLYALIALPSMERLCQPANTLSGCLTGSGNSPL